MNDYILKAMPYFKKQTWNNFEIVLVLEKPAEISFQNTRLIVSGRASPAQARNIGAKNSKGEIIAFIDDDAYPAKDWLEKAELEFKDKNIVAVGGPSLVPHKATFFQKVSNKVYELSSSKTGIRYGEHKKRREIDDWPTCNFFVRKKDFLKVKGFDEKYWGGEDTQVCYSLIKTGKKMFYNPELIIYHHPRKTLWKHLKQTFFWGMWRGFFMSIHKQSRQLTFFIPALFVIWLIFGGLNALVFAPFSKIYLLTLLIYAAYLIYTGIRTKNAKLFLPVASTTFLTHLAYGLGFLRGIISTEAPIKKTLNPSESLKTKKT